MSIIIPRTQVRLQPYIKVSGVLYNMVNDIPTPTGAWTPVFAVQKVSIVNSRPVNFYRELNTDNYKGTNPKPIMETYPGLPTYELTLERVILYSGSLLEALGFYNSDNSQGGQDVFSQDKPLMLQFALYQPPTTAGGSDSAVTYTYHGCWFKDNPLDFDITQDDLKMIQSIGVTAAGVTRG